MSEEDEP